MGRSIENENLRKREGIDLEAAANEVIDVLYKYGIKISLVDAVFKRVKSKVQSQNIVSSKISR